MQSHPVYRTCFDQYTHLLVTPACLVLAEMRPAQWLTLHNI